MDYIKYLEERFPLIKREEYKECNLPKKEKSILCEIGLPDINEYMPPFFFQFNTQKNFPIYLEDDWQDNGGDLDSAFRYVVIGYDEYEQPVCINNKNEIVLIPCFDDRKDSEGFVNSNLECFLECLVVYLSYSDKLDETDIMLLPASERREKIKTILQDRAEVVRELRQRIEQIDSRALDNPDLPWAFHLEELENGIM